MSETPIDLRSHPFVIDLSESAQERLSECAVGTVHWEPGTKIFREGGVSENCYLIMYGIVAVEAHSPGRDAKVLQTLGQGDVLGWSWLFPPYRWTFDAHVRAETEAVQLDAVKLREYMDTDRELGYEVLFQFSRLVVRRLNATRLQLLDLYADHS